MVSTSWQLDQEARIFCSKEVQPSSGRDILDTDENLLRAKSHGGWTAVLLEQLLNPELPGDPPAFGAGTEKGGLPMPSSQCFSSGRET